MNTPIFSAQRWAVLLALLTGMLFLAAPAQADPPGRIGRIALLSGTVNLNNPNSGESFAAPLNQPLTSGDTITTDSGSRTEIQIGSMTVRLDANSRLGFERIDDEQVRLYLENGRVIVKLSSPEAIDDFTLETRNGRFNARSTGIYRFDTDASSTTGTAYYGSLHFAASDSALAIGPGQNAQFWQDGQSIGQTRHRLLPAPNDDFTRWSAERDQRPAANTYSRYVSPEMTGAADLDAYGNWSENAEYGSIWFPRAVAADWAPYRSGHWAWVSPWGWTWIGNEPWGFAPFHYGRWVHHHGRWGWVPGARIARPVYAPAMVAWIGAPGIGLSLSFGSAPAVGWFPLAPREVYVPAYRSSANYVRQVNITHVTHITNVTTIVNNPQAMIQQTRYAHRELPHAVTVVPASDVTQRRSVAPARLSARDFRALREQPLQATAPVIVPQDSASAERRTRPEQRPERSGQADFRRERELRAPVMSAPVMPENRVNISPVSPAAAQAPVVATPRNERTMPEISRQTPPTRSEPLVVPPANQQAEMRHRQERPELAFPRREREQQAPAVMPPPVTAGHNIVQPTPVPATQLPVNSSQRLERVTPEIARPVAQPRSEPVEIRVQERPVPREVRVEPAPQPIRQAPPARIETRVVTPAPATAPALRESRHEAAREVSRPPEARVEIKTQRQEGRPQPAASEKQGHRRDETERR